MTITGLPLSEFGPRDDIGPHIRDAESAADELGNINPMRLVGDADRIMAAAMKLIRIASAARAAYRQHGERAA
jgi:hypothetical protein